MDFKHNRIDHNDNEGLPITATRAAAVVFGGHLSARSRVLLTHSPPPAR